jgi:hypothetical protein
MKQILGKENSSKFAVYSCFWSIGFFLRGNLFFISLLFAIIEKTNLEKRLSLIRKMCKVVNDPRAQMHPMLNHQMSLGNTQMADEAEHCSSSSSSSLSSSSSMNYFTSAHRFKCFFKKNHQRFNLNIKSKQNAFNSAPNLKRKVIHSNENAKSDASRLERDLVYRQKVQEEERNQQAKLERIIFNLNLLNRVQLKYVQSYAEKRSFQNQAVLVKRKPLAKKVENNQVNTKVSHKEADLFSWLILDSKSKNAPKISSRNIRSLSLLDLANITTSRKKFERNTKEEYSSDSENYYQILDEDSSTDSTSFFTCRTQSLPQVG